MNTMMKIETTEWWCLVYCCKLCLFKSKQQIHFPAYGQVRFSPWYLYKRNPSTSWYLAYVQINDINTGAWITLTQFWEPLYSWEISMYNLNSKSAHWKWRLQYFTRTWHLSKEHASTVENATHGVRVFLLSHLPFSRKQSENWLQILVVTSWHCMP